MSDVTSGVVLVTVACRLSTFAGKNYRCNCRSHARHALLHLGKKFVIGGIFVMLHQEVTSDCNYLYIR
jgi:hypothetical protein